MESDAYAINQINWTHLLQRPTAKIFLLMSYISSRKGNKKGEILRILPRRGLRLSKKHFFTNLTCSIVACNGIRADSMNSLAS